MIEYNNALHGAAIAAAIPRSYNPIDTVISHSQDGVLLGGVSYDSNTWACIFMHQAGFSKRWLTRDMLWVVFHYPFIQLGCRKVCGIVPASAPDLLAFDLRLGFSEETRIRDAYPDGDMIILSMKREDCPWLKVRPRSIKAGQ